MTVKLIRNLIEAGYTDDEITEVIKAKSGKQPEAKPAENPEPKPAENPEPKPAENPEPKPADNSDLINAIKSLEMTIKASNLVSYMIDTQSPEKTADDVLAEMLAPKGGK